MSEADKPAHTTTKPITPMGDPVFGRGKAPLPPGTAFDPHQSSDFTPAAGNGDD